MPLDPIEVEVPLNLDWCCEELLVPVAVAAFVDDDDGVYFWLYMVLALASSLQIDFQYSTKILISI